MQAALTPLHDVDEALRMRWRELAEQAVEPNPYFDPDLCLPAARLLKAPARTALLHVRVGDDLVWAAPVRRVSRVSRVPVPALMGWHHEYSFCGVPLARADHLEASWAAARRAAAATGAALVVLPMARVDGQVAAACRRVVAGVRVLDVFDRPVLLRRAADDYLVGRLSRRRAKDLRRHARRLSEEVGPLDLLDRAGDPDAVEDLLRAELSGWKGQRGTAIGCRAADRAWFHEVCARFAERGALQLWTLGGVAHLAVLTAGRSVFHVKIAHEAAHDAHSPGLQLEVAAVSAFHADPDFDRLDSGTAGGASVSALLYPDREATGTLLVPAAGLADRARTALLPTAVRAGRRARDVLRRPS